MEKAGLVFRAQSQGKGRWPPPPPARLEEESMFQINRVLVNQKAKGAFYRKLNNVGRN